MGDIRCAGSAAARGRSIAGIVQIATARETDLDTAVAVDVGSAGTGHRAFTSVTNKRVSVSCDLLDNVACTGHIDLKHSHFSFERSI